MFKQPPTVTGPNFLGLYSGWIPVYHVCQVGRWQPGVADSIIKLMPAQKICGSASALHY